MPTKRAAYEIAEFKADTREGHKGEVTAIVSVFGNVDTMGDRVMPGAFGRSLDKWEKSGDPIPVFWSHDWTDPDSLIGFVKNAAEVDRGLQVTMKLDIEDNPRADRVYKLLASRRVKEFSFGYRIVEEKKAKDGANELLDLDILEVGPTFKGANELTELLTVKDAGNDTKAGRRHSAETTAELSQIRQHFQDGIARIDFLLGSEDADEEPKSQPYEEEPPATSTSETEHMSDDGEPPAKSIDDEVLALTLRIEEMRIS